MIPFGEWTRKKVTAEAVAKAVKPEQIEESVRKVTSSQEFAKRVEQIIEKRDLDSVVNQAVTAHFGRVLTTDRIASAIKQEDIAAAIKRITSSEEFTKSDAVRKLVQSELVKGTDFQMFVKDVAKSEQDKLAKAIEAQIITELAGLKLKPEEVQREITGVLKAKPELIQGPIEKVVANSIDKQLQAMFAESKIFEDAIQKTLAAKHEELAKAATNLREVQIDTVSKFAKEYVAKLVPNSTKRLHIYPDSSPAYVEVYFYVHDGSYFAFITLRDGDAAPDAVRKRFEKQYGHKPDGDEEVFKKFGTPKDKPDFEKSLIEETDNALTTLFELKANAKVRIRIE